MKVKDIEIRLEELDRMESQILFSVSILSADDHVRLARIKEERAELKAKLEKMNEKKDKQGIWLHFNTRTGKVHK